MSKMQNFHILLEDNSPSACKREIDLKNVLFFSVVLTTKSDFDLKSIHRTGLHVI